MCVKCITGKEKEKSRNMSNKREKSISQEAGATAAAVVGTVRGTELEWISKSMKNWKVHDNAHWRKRYITQLEVTTDMDPHVQSLAPIPPTSLGHGYGHRRRSISENQGKVPFSCAMYRLCTNVQGTTRANDLPRICKCPGEVKCVEHSVQNG